MAYFPPVPPTLLSALEEAFKPLAVTPSHDLPTIFFHAGEQNVLRFLRQKRDEQEKAGLAL